MTSYNTDGTVGPWAKEKLEYLRKYLNAYTTILKSQKWCEGFIYVDAFAGAGVAPLRKYDSPKDNGELLVSVSNFANETEQERLDYVKGSPRVALDLTFPFTEYIFIEMNPERISELEKLKKEYEGKRNITILKGDATSEIQNYVLSGKYNWKKSRGVVFLDPFGMQVPWSTIEKIGQVEALEIILNLPVGMAIQRLLPRDGKFSDEQRKQLNAYFGSPEWEKIVYEETQDLFGLIKSKATDAGLKLAKWYQKRLKDAFGNSPNPRLIKNTRGTHLYYLLWAGKNSTGAKIAADVLSQGDKL